MTCNPYIQRPHRSFGFFAQSFTNVVLEKMLQQEQVLGYEDIFRARSCYDMRTAAPLREELLSDASESRDVRGGLCLLRWLGAL